jgi:methionyl aminopeptidase
MKEGFVVAVILKSAREVEHMRRAGKVVRQVLDHVRDQVQAWRDDSGPRKCRRGLLKDLGAKAAFKGYHGYPACFAPRSTAKWSTAFPPRPGAERRRHRLHRLRRDRRRLLRGRGDHCSGGREDRQEDPAAAGGNAGLLQAAIEIVKPGATLGDIGAAVQEVVEAEGFSVVRDFVGHGIGTRMHEDPQVPNYGERGRGMKLREGMVLAIEPMVNAGKPGVEVLKDGWTAVTEDGSMSAHFEHTVAVTATGAMVLTE